jgi:dolichol-phosphate mannosyltransferase
MSIGERLRGRSGRRVVPISAEVPLARAALGGWRPDDAMSVPGDGSHLGLAVVVLPTYNEAENVQRTLRTVLGVMDAAAYPVRIVVVDDGSPDGTADLAAAVAEEDDRVTVLRGTSKEGLGVAYGRGFRHAFSYQPALVIQMDCDGSHSPHDLPRLVEGTRSSDVTLGSRYVAGGAIRNWTLGRRVLSRFGCWYARRVLGVQVRDLTGGFKCFRADVLERLLVNDVSAHGYGFQIEMTYRALIGGFRVAEVPITFAEREAGASKMSRAIALEAAVLVPRLRRNSKATARPAPVRRR